MSRAKGQNTLPSQAHATSAAATATTPAAVASTTAGGSASATKAHLFVGNVSPDADDRYLTRLFTVYGPVEQVIVHPPATPLSATHAVVQMTYADDADVALAALHLRYCMTPHLPVIVLYAKSSPIVTQYGREVGEHYRSSIEKGEQPMPLPLENFDSSIARGPHPVLPTDFTLPPAPNMANFGGASPWAVPATTSAYR
jgi:hypothetical protein